MPEQPAQHRPRPDYGSECVIRLASGATIRTDTYADSPGGSSYVRVCAPDGSETGYWSCTEWAEAPQEVMGAILGAAATPARPGPGGPFRLTGDAAVAAWLAGEGPGAGFLYNQDIAGLIQDAAGAGIITAGPDGAVLSAECCTDRDGTPDCWRVLVHVPALGCCLASDPCQATEDAPGALELLRQAAGAANDLLSGAGHAAASAEDRMSRAVNDGTDFVTGYLDIGDRDIDLGNIFANAIATAWHRQGTFTWEDFISENWSASPGEDDDPATWHDWEPEAAPGAAPGGTGSGQA